MIGKDTKGFENNQTLRSGGGGAKHEFMALKNQRDPLNDSSGPGLPPIAKQTSSKRSSVLEGSHVTESKIRKRE